jgi:hypothetical protein
MLSVYLKDDAENLNAEEIQEAIKTELDHLLSKCF